MYTTCIKHVPDLVKKHVREKQVPISFHINELTYLVRSTETRVPPKSKKTFTVAQIEEPSSFRDAALESESYHKAKHIRILHAAGECRPRMWTINPMIPNS